MTQWRETTPRDELPLEPKPSLWARLQDGLNNPICDACLIIFAVMAAVIFAIGLKERYF